MMSYCVTEGPEKKSVVIEQKNKELVAFHEGGHAIVALFTPGQCALLIILINT